MQKTINQQALGGLGRRVSALVLIIALGLCAACGNAKGLGNRAYEAGDYQRALQYYEEEMVHGAHDAELYFRAAEAASRVGNFSTAERYYSLSLRYGGGVTVARHLAQFYVQTSNYARAVRVYQFLLKHEDDIQPVYNNLGTALMYAGLPLDAESYLLIAQQMQPQDALPYVNLGVLYDQHLKRPRLALAFFQCYLELAKNQQEQERAVEARVQEMTHRNAIGLEDEGLKCGEAYRPVSHKVENLKRHFEGDEWRDGDVIDLGTGGDESAAPEASDVVIERMAEGDSAVDRSKQPDVSTRSGAKQRARTAFEEKRFEEAVRELSQLPVDLLDPGDMALLGSALARSGRAGDAIPWLEWSLNREARPDTVSILLEVYTLIENKERIQEVCRRFSGRAQFAGALKNCPAVAPGL
ncbi:MAG: tetratricopeptide repeat protein [Bradymonadaceae bacterium]|nr:tetratricopeptide repeat protein [Lujinxingiaceae bacterium]